MTTVVIIAVTEVVEAEEDAGGDGGELLPALPWLVGH